MASASKSAGKLTETRTRIRVLLTGGTVDKEYDELSGELIINRTKVPEMLRNGRCRLELATTQLMMMDSRNLTERDLHQIVECCEASSEDRILIVHGTDTMVRTARYLGERLTAKTVVLTGALVPYSCVGSDGPFNLGNALAFVQMLPPGVYVSINGRYFPWDNVTKDFSTGEFVELQPR